MRVVIGYESMYGNTRRIAEAIGTGFHPDDDVSIVPTSRIDLTRTTPDLLILGTPTHAHGLPGPSSRRAALETAQTANEQHDVDADAAVDTGTREWLSQLPARLDVAVATFDTRFRPPAWMVGHPARRVARMLRRRGARLLSRPESFFVDKHEQLRPGEVERARSWGASIRDRASIVTAGAPR